MVSSLTFPSLPVDSKEGDKFTVTVTEYILIACLGVFAIVLIVLIFLAVQIARLNKSVKNLKM